MNSVPLHEDRLQRALEAMSEQLADEVIVRQGWSSLALNLYDFVCEHTGHHNCQKKHPNAELLKSSMRMLRAEEGEQNMTQLLGKPRVTKRDNTATKMRLRVSKLMKSMRYDGTENLV